MRLDQIEQAAPKATKAAAGTAQARTAVLVLGMHRSGTSALTRVLNILGCDLPSNVIGPGKSNRLGYWEPHSIVTLNDRILASAGTSWSDWQKFGEAWAKSPKASEFREEAQRTLTEEFGGSYFFTLKDPRICRFPRFWIEALEAFGVRPVAMLPVRNPLEVAASLAARDAFEPRLGQLIWLRNVLDAEAGTRGLARSFSSYETLLTGWNAVARRAESELGIVWPRMSDAAAAEVDSFIDGAERHHAEAEARVAEDLTLPGWLRESYAIFSRWAREGEDAGDFDVLDAIRAELDGAAPAFGRLVAAGRQAADEARSLRRSLERSEAAAAGAERLKQEASRQADVIGELRSKLDTARAEAAEQARRVEEAEAALGVERAEAATRARELGGLKEQLARQVGILREARTRMETALSARQERAEELADETRAREDAERALAQARTELEQAGRTLDERTVEATRLAGELARLQDELGQVTAARTEAEKMASGYREHVALLLEDGRRHARELVELRQQKADAAHLVGNSFVVLALGRPWPGLRRLQVRLAARRLRRTGVVDGDWYLAQNDDVREAKVDPVLHYIVHGASEGRAPNPLMAQHPRGKARG